MITLPAPLPTDRRALQDLAQCATQDLMNTFDLDFITANRRARTMYPALFAAEDKSLSAPSAPLAPILSNAEAAAIPHWNEADLDRVGMAKDSELPDIKAAWEAGGNALNPDKADDIFDALVSRTGADRGIGTKAAEQLVRGKHKNLALKSDTIKMRKKLTDELPATSDLASPAFSSKNRPA